MTEQLAKIAVSVERYKVPLDPPADVFHVEVLSGDGVWEETFGTEDLVHAFLRGVQAGAFPNAHVPLYEIPREAKPLPALGKE